MGLWYGGDGEGRVMQGAGEEIREREECEGFGR